jgi:hypothetical protein
MLPRVSSTRSGVPERIVVYYGFLLRGQATESSPSRSTLPDLLAGAFRCLLSPRFYLMGLSLDRDGRGCRSQTCLSS